AIENWSRLDAARFPARLAAPFRLQIDPSFQVAQSPEAQVALRHQGERIQSNTVLAGLRATQRHFLKNEGLRAAFREADSLVRVLGQEAPHLIPKLANCFYWQIIQQGDPEDAGRFLRLFGKPPDDPQFYRVGALICESQPAYGEANEFWRQYENEIAASPEV